MASASPNVSSYRGANHVLVTRKSTRAALRARTRKLLATHRWPSVHLHGLGAAIAPTIVLAGELVAASEGQLVASCSTSTEVLVDHASDADGASALRHNSAIHVELRQAELASAAARGGAAARKARGRSKASANKSRPQQGGST